MQKWKEMRHFKSKLNTLPKKASQDQRGETSTQRQDIAVQQMLCCFQEQCGIFVDYTLDFFSQKKNQTPSGTELDLIKNNLSDLGTWLNHCNFE